MFIDPTQKILDLDGNDILDNDNKTLTFGYLAVMMLMSQFKGEEDLPGPQKLDRFELAEKFHKASLPVEINNDQGDLILRLCQKGLPTLSYARMSRIVTQAKSAPAPKKAAAPVEDQVPAS